MKMKYIMEGVLLTVVIALLIHLLTFNDMASEMISVKEIPMMTKRLTSLQERIDKIKDEDCRNSIDTMLKRVKSTYFSENITIEEYYNAYTKDEKNFIDFYEDVNNSCKLDGNDDIYFLVLSSLNYPNSIKRRYDLRYEFIFKDTFNRENNYQNSDEVGTYTTKMSELQVVSKLLDEVE